MRPICACVAGLAVLCSGSTAVAGSTITVGPGGGYDHATIQPAIDAAVSGDEVVVADGIYTGADNKNLDLGGRLITVRSESGDPTACVIDCEGSGRGFHFHTGETEAAVVDGFTVRNGSVADFGGAILCDAAGPKIRNCDFTDNTATLFGGGMHNANGAGPTVVDCTFTGNTANSGFLIGGGGMSNLSSSPTVEGCVFDTNSASLSGGGMASYIANPVVIGCTFENNGATGDGGGMYSTQSDPTLINCAFRENQAANGGGMYTDTGIASLTNCAFVGNTATYGAGLFNTIADATLVNCTLQGNTATAIGGGGGGILYAGSSIVTLANCILWGNADVSGTGETAQLRSEGGGTPNVTYTCIQDADPNDAGIYPGTGNIDDDPHFAGPDDLRLLGDSPCADVGDNTAVPADTFDLDDDGDTAEPVPFDLDGVIRISDGIVDMGAYEVSGDNDLDGIPNDTDNCPHDPNPGQEDADGDGVGDPCDACPGFDDRLDADGDGVPDDCDACPGFDDKADADHDTVADGCDNCPNTTNADQADDDGDGVGDVCDACPGFDDAMDSDGDGNADGCDLCPGFDDRLDNDGDGVPDDCDDDDDDDGAQDAVDNCPLTSNADQANADGDAHGDVCDNCPGAINDGQEDADGDGAGDACDVCPGADDAADADGDGVPDGCDICPGHDDNVDTDGDGVPNGCDLCEGCPGNTISVGPGGAFDFERIQDGIDAAVDGDTVVVTSGTYAGGRNRNLDCGGKRITVKSHLGPEVTTIDCGRLGRGFYFHSGETPETIIDGFTITEGVGDPNGGGISCVDSSPAIKNCRVSDNITAGEGRGGGGGIYTSGGNPIISACVIDHNSAAHNNGWGAGIAALGGDPTIEDCLVLENFGGGGVYLVDTTAAVIRRCVVRFGDGGIGLSEGGTTTIVNCLIADNQGGGISCGESTNSPQLLHCTIVRNGRGTQGGIPTITNCIIQGNSERGASMGPNAAVTFSNIQDGEGEHWFGEGCIDADPHFLDADNGLFQLRPGSPSIDTGTNAPPGGLPATDIDGVARPQDGDGDAVAVADMGAYEWWSGGLPAIGVSSPLIEFFVDTGDADPHVQVLTVENAGGGTLSWRLGESCDWLTPDVTRADDGPAESTDVTLEVSAAGLPPGEYPCTLTISAPTAINSPRTVQVTLHVISTYRVPAEYPTIQAAIDATTLDGDVVLVADGVYTGPGNKNLDFGGKRITVRSENGPENCIIDCEGDGRGFHLHSGETVLSTIDGLTVRNGNSGTTGGNRYGGAILCDGSGATIENCILRENSTPYGGGAIAITASSNVVIRACVIKDNVSNSAGALSLGGTVLIENCQIAGNTGGGIAAGGCQLEITHTTISENTDVDTGGISLGANCTGTISDSDITGNIGRGMRIYASDITVRNCRIGSNIHHHKDIGGGGLYILRCAPLIEDCLITANEGVKTGPSGSTGGGGVLCFDRADPRLTRCIITDNVTIDDVHGGGVACDQESRPVLTDCLIARNQSRHGGGVHIGYLSAPTLVGCLIEENDAKHGGGISGSGGLIQNCVIGGNVASDGEGGGIRGANRLIDSWIVDNRATERGGGIVLDEGDSRLENCVIARNTGVLSGGGIRVRGWSQTAVVEIVNCTVVGNVAAQEGGGVEVAGSSNVAVANSILWGNAADHGSELAITTDPYRDPSAVAVSYSDVEGGIIDVYSDPGNTLEWGEGNIDVAPSFAFARDYHLLAGSDCIDVGSNNPPGGLPPDDLNGNARPLGASADMGAYEYNASAPSIALSTDAVEVFAPLGGPNPDDVILQIRNAGGVALNWQATGDCTWLSVVPSSDLAAPDEIDDVVLSVSTAGLTHGDYTCDVTVSDPAAVNDPRTVAVTLHVNITSHVPSGYATIQEAIDASIDGDVVLLADGIYTGVGNKDLDFGGRAIAVRSASGADNCIIDCEGAGRGFHFHNLEGPASVVDGLTIRNGFIDGEYSGGGAVLCDGSSPTLVDLTIRDNAVGEYGIGGGVLCTVNSHPLISECRILGNTATARSSRGGGVACLYNSRPTIAECTLAGNSGGSGGGVYCDQSSPVVDSCSIIGGENLSGSGIYCYDGSNPAVSNCIITDHLHAAIACREMSSPSFSGCTISNNVTTLTSSSHRAGAAVDCRDYSSPIISDCVIADNLLAINHSSARGAGAIYCDDDSNATIVRTMIRNNLVSGAVNRGVAVQAVDNSSLTITECDVIDNGGRAGAIVLGSGTSTVANCTISRNAGSGLHVGENSVVSNCTITDNDGYGLFLGSGGSPTVNSCTIANNRGSSNGGIVCSTSGATITNCITWNNIGGNLVLENDAQPLITHCDIQGGYPGEGNIDADPRFVALPLAPEIFVDLANTGDPLADGSAAHPYASLQEALGDSPYSYRLADDSPCIGTGADGVNMGADNGIGGTAGSTSSLFHVAAGTYSLDGFDFARRYSLIGAGRDQTTLEGTASWLRTGATLEDVTVTGGTESGVRIIGLDESPTIEDCSVTGNTAEHGGGLFCSYSSPLVRRCAITDNTATNDGGGLYVRSAAVGLTDCVLIGNTAVDDGGGAYIYGGNPLMVNVDVSGNAAGDDGGGVSVYLGTPTFVNATFSGNTANGDGGAFHGDRGDPVLVNSTLAGNASLNGGGGIYVGPVASVTVANAVLWGNTADDGATTDESAQVYTAGGEVTVSYSCIQDEDPGDLEIPFGGLANGNIDDDPMVVRLPDPGPDGAWDGVDDDYGDLRLLPVSRCIDAADNTAVPADAPDLDDDSDTTEPVPFDRAGNTRFRDDFATLDTGNGSPPIVDMGAYELPGLPALRRIVGGLDGADNSASLIWPKAEEIALAAFEIEVDQAVTYVGSSVTTTGGATVPTVNAFAHIDGGVHRVELDGPIPLGHWTVVTLTVADASGGESTFELCLGHLPADINGDGQVNLNDATAFGLYLMTEPGSPAYERLDLNDDGQANLNDATLFGQLWHGTAGHQRWQGETLPVKP